MSCLYVNESGAVISVDGGYFCVQECLRRGVIVNYCSGKGAYYGRLFGVEETLICGNAPGFDSDEDEIIMI